MGSRTATLRLAVALAMAGLAATAAASTPGAASAPDAAASAIPALGSAALQASRRQTIEVEDARILSMSPDGTRFAAVRPAVAFQRGRLCAYAVATAKELSCADLSGLESGIRIEDVAWSPDSRLLAFAERAFLLMTDGDLWLMDTDTGELTNLDDDSFRGTLPIVATDPPDGTISIPSSPTFTPDGRGVTYSRSLLRDGVRAGDAIVTVPVAGGPAHVHTYASLDEVGVAYHGMRWAPDGSRLYYSVAHADPKDHTNGIWMVSADGIEVRQLVGGAGADAWTSSLQVLQVAPDGAHLLAWSPLAWSDFSSPDPVFAVVDARTGAATPVTILDPDAPPYAFVGWAGFSPDGRSLLTQRFSGNAALDAWVRDVDGTTETQLARDPDKLAGWVEAGIPLTWAPNGTVFLTGAGQLGSATLLTVPGSAVTAP